MKKVKRNKKPAKRKSSNLPKLNRMKRETLIKLLNKGVSAVKIADRYGISTSAVYYYKRRGLKVEEVTAEEQAEREEWDDSEREAVDPEPLDADGEPPF